MKKNIRADLDQKNMHRVIDGNTFTGSLSIPWYELEGTNKLEVLDEPINSNLNNITLIKKSLKPKRIIEAAVFAFLMFLLILLTYIAFPEIGNTWRDYQ